jgi:hypothetical protein
MCESGETNVHDFGNSEVLTFPYQDVSLLCRYPNTRVFKVELSGGPLCCTSPGHCRVPGRGDGGRVLCLAVLGPDRLADE